MSRKKPTIPRKIIRPEQRKLEETQVEFIVDGTLERRDVRASLAKYFELFLDGLHRVLIQPFMRDLRQVITSYFKHLDSLITAITAIVRGLEPEEMREAGLCVESRLLLYLSEVQYASSKWN